MLQYSFRKHNDKINPRYRIMYVGGLKQNSSGCFGDTQARCWTEGRALSRVVGWGGQNSPEALPDQDEGPLPGPAQDSWPRLRATCGAAAALSGQAGAPPGPFPPADAPGGISPGRRPGPLELDPVGERDGRCPCPLGTGGWGAGLSHPGQACVCLW